MTESTEQIAEHMQGRGGYSYPLAIEVSEKYDWSISQANDEILAALRQLVALDGEGLILDREPIKPELLADNPHDLDVDHWLTVSETTAAGIREAIAHAVASE